MMADIEERAEKGREILKSRAAQGEPGEKQPAHRDAAAEAQKTVDELKGLQEKYGAETRPPSGSQEVKNHPVAPQDRKPGPAPASTASIQAAAAALGAASAHIENQLIADARIASDPRYELDQKKFEMGQAGTLAFVPPSEEEVAAMAARSGVDSDVVKEAPKTPQEQVQRDMPRLAEAEKRAAQVRGAEITGAEANVPDSQVRTGAGRPSASAPSSSASVKSQTTDQPNQPTATGAGTSASTPGTEATGGGTPVK